MIMLQCLVDAGFMAKLKKSELLASSTKIAWLLYARGKAFVMLPLTGCVGGGQMDPTNKERHLGTVRVIELSSVFHSEFYRACGLIPWLMRSDKELC